MMKAFTLATALLIACHAQSVRCDERSDSSGKVTTLSELSKLPNVKIVVERLPRADDPGFVALESLGFPKSELPKPDFDHPRIAVKILFFRGATVFGPEFFQNLGSSFLSKEPRELRAALTSDLKLYLVVRGADQAELARVPLAYEALGDEDGPAHLKIIFNIAPATMQHSYLLIEEYPPSTNALSVIRTKVDLGAPPDQK